MNLTVFRDEYRAFRIALAEAEQASTSDDRIKITARVYDRFADLFTLDATRDIVRQVNESQHTTTERDARARLLAAQREFFTSARTAPLAGELARREVAANVEWRGAQIAAHHALRQIAGDESSHVARQELVSRALDQLQQCDDLRDELRAAEQDASRLWDAEQRSASIRTPAATNAVDVPMSNAITLHTSAPQTAESELIQNHVREDSPTDLLIAKLSVGAKGFLERTASPMREERQRWRQADQPDTPSDTLTFADAQRFLRLAHLDAYFATGTQRRFYEETLRSLQINPTTQPNVSIFLSDDESLTSACFAVAPPADVRLRINTEKGVDSFSQTLDAAGQAQHAAWTSADLAARYPELVYTLADDDATPRASGLLFATLMRDAQFISAHRRIELGTAQMLAPEIAARELYSIRRLCALLDAEINLKADANGLRQQNFVEHMATSLSEATFFQHDQSAARLEIGRGNAANDLRARLFAVAWQERLRTRYGSRWWASARARDELIDVWNTGARYTVEELAKLIDAGELSFDLLAEDLTGTLTHDRR